MPKIVYLYMTLEYLNWTRVFLYRFPGVVPESEDQVAEKARGRDGHG